MPKIRREQGILSSEIAEVIQGDLRGDRNLRIFGVSSLQDATSGEMSFIERKSALATAKAATATTASLLLVDSKYKDITFEQSVIFVSGPAKATQLLLPFFFEPDSYPFTIHPSAIINPTTKIAPDVRISANVVIDGDCSIDSGTVIHPGVVIYRRVTIGARVTIHANGVIREDTVIGDDCVIQPGAVIGADGFGFITNDKGELVAVPQLGSVTLGRQVRIGSNSCIDRAALGDTKIGNSVKVDNLVQIGHNVKIGDASILCGQSGVAGSSTIGSRVVLGGQAGVADHVNICSNTRFTAKSGVVSDIVEPGDYADFPAKPIGDWRREQGNLKKLSQKRYGKN